MATFSISLAQSYMVTFMANVSLIVGFIALRRVLNASLLYLLTSDDGLFYRSILRRLRTLNTVNTFRGGVILVRNRLLMEVVAIIADVDVQ